MVIEVTKTSSVYQFIIPVGSPLGEAYDACFEVLNSLVEMSKEAEAAAEKNTTASKEAALAAQEVPAELVNTNDA